MPEYMPFAEFVEDRTSGGSPLVNVATMRPLPIEFPHVSTSVTVSGVGHDAGAEKLLTRPVCVGTSCPPAQVGAVVEATAGTRAAEAPVVALCTISVTFTERTALANEKLTLPR